MANRQKVRYVLSALNGIDIEAIGAKNLKTMTNIFEDCRFHKVRFINPKPKEPDADVVKRLQKPK